MKLLLTVLISTVQLWPAVAQTDRHTAIVRESFAQICKQVTHKQAGALAGLIMVYGKRCEIVSAVIPFAFSYGFQVNCNR